MSPAAATCRRLEQRVAGDRQLAAQVEQIVLHLGERVARSSRGSSSASSTPIVEFSSSTSPRATTRALSFATREPSPRPVSPASPVRVVIFERRWPMVGKI